MLRVGLTGGIASGKSSVARLLEQKGAKFVESDRLAHQLLKKGTPTWKKIVHAFGEEILDTSKSIDRKKLAKVVFSQPKKLRHLEQILHPPVIAEIQKWLAGCQKEKRVAVAVVEIPLLFEKKLERLFDRVVAVSAPRKEQIARLAQKGFHSRKEILARMKSQMSQSEKAKRADFVVRNSGDKKELKKKVDFLWEELNRF